MKCTIDLTALNSEVWARKDVAVMGQGTIPCRTRYVIHSCHLSNRFRGSVRVAKRLDSAGETVSNRVLLDTSALGFPEERAVVIP